MAGAAPPPLSLNPDDEALHDPLINWATTAGMIHPAGGQHPTAQFAAALNPADGASFAGSVVGLPLYTHNTTHCVLLLAHPQPRYFDRQDLEFLKSLAPFAALAIDNAKTYIHLENSNQRLSTLQSINALTYNAELPLNRVLRLAVEGIRQNMGYPAVILCLPEENSHSLLIRAASGALDKFLRRRGDTPTRRIAFPLNDDSNPFSKSFAAKKIQSAPVQTWATALQQAQALDMAGALSGQKTSRCIALPLWRGEKVIGLLVVGREDPAPPTGDEQAMLTSLANQIAMVVTNASLYQAEQQGRREMEALYRAGLVITSTLSHAEVLKAIIRQIVDLTFVESCIIGRWDEVKEVEVIELHLQKTPAGWLEKVPSGTAYPLSERPLVWQTLQTQTLTTIRGDDPSLPPAEQEWMAAENAALRLILPLLIRDKSIGVIELITTQTGHVFSEHIIRLAR
ncbi:MAG: GAF domain-containing protein, partial [Anaerolineae bacterium]